MFIYNLSSRLWPIANASKIAYYILSSAPNFCLLCLNYAPLLCKVLHCEYWYQDVTRSGKTGLICTTAEIHFLSVATVTICESYTHTLSRNTKYLTINGQVCFQTAFC